MIRKNQKYPVKWFLSLVKLNHTKKNIWIIDNDPIKLGSDRYKTFITSGTKCVNCGLQASYFVKEKHENEYTYHMNLYGLKNNEEVLFTKDHIHPKSKGGANHLSNYQTMCYICNKEKSNKI